jgi:hypothetical protein
MPVSEEVFIAALARVCFLLDAINCSIQNARVVDRGLDSVDPDPLTDHADGIRRTADRMRAEQCPAAASAGSSSSPATKS